VKSHAKFEELASPVKKLHAFHHFLTANCRQKAPKAVQFRRISRPFLP